MSRTIEITEFTDPYCTWCWGSEPVLRTLKERYGDQLSLRFVMGGLVKDRATFYDPSNNIDGDGMATQLAAHWADASRRHGMPVDLTEFARVVPPTTWPANIAYLAAKAQDQGLADRYLRRMREAVATESQPLHEIDVLASLAAEVGLDRERFLADYHGEARAAFDADRLECAQRGAQGFPSFMIRVDDRATMASGYRTVDQMQQLIDLVAGAPVDRATTTFDDLAVLDVVQRYGSVTVREIVEVFTVTPDQARESLERLADSALLTLGSNGLIYRPAAAEVCDVATGTCA